MKAQKLKDSICCTRFFTSELAFIPLPKGNGWSDGGLCPFHHDRRPGSFKINLESGAFTCFACGAKGGDIIKFMELRYNLSFLEAMERLSYEYR